MNQLRERLDDQNLSEFVVLEGGAAFGIGYEFGILDEFRDQGADFSDAHMLGTSAGSWVASAMAKRLQFEQVADQPQIKLFNQKPNYMRGYAKELFGDTHADNVNATATELPTLHLKIRNGGDHQLADLVAPSSAVPGLFFPAIASNRLWWDGAVARLSAGYAHMAPRADTLLVVSALSSHLKMPLGRLADIPGQVLETKSLHDMSRWQSRNPEGKVIRIRPNRAISGIVKNPKDLFDFDIARDVYWMAREQAAEMMDKESPHYRESIASFAIRNTQLPA